MNIIKKYSFNDLMTNQLIDIDKIQPLIRMITPQA